MTDTDLTARGAVHQRQSTSSELRGAAAVFAAVGIMLVAANLRPAVVSVGPLLDTISEDQGFSSAAAGLLTTLPVLFFGLSAPVAPRLAARFGIERTIFGALVLLLAAIALRLVPDVVALFAGSMAVGAAIGVCNVVLPALIKRDFAHRSGMMTGLYSMTLSGGAAVAAGVTVPIDDALGGNWRLTLAVWGVLALLALVQWLPQLRRVHTIRDDAGGGSLYRDRVAWAITVYMGAQSLIFYTFGAWLPTYLLDRGMTHGEAGTTLALGQVAGLLTSLTAPMIAGRMRDQRAIALAFLVFCAIGFIGLVSTDAVPLLWVCLVMMGPGSGISLALLFMVLRSNSTAQTGQVSGMAQSIGYGLAAIGPILIGAVHDASGSWNLAMSVLALAIVPQALSALRAARAGTMRAG
ncbi:MFS transporter [Flexivirga sp. ID2601S]|uniref:MFS transporter n=1 Tax=Flexivirga aerilata TaxID=1656889 RepID=A0A849AF02_9MICO|nr:MFS transporter [Flexivirga aerilata]NNG39009.1 MFS transporter [Flexivirga aerilata]